MIGQSQVIVRAQVEDRLAVGDADVRPLRRGDDPLGFIQPGLANAPQFRRDLLAHSAKHGVSSRRDGLWNSIVGDFGGIVKAARGMSIDEIPMTNKARFVI